LSRRDGKERQRQTSYERRAGESPEVQHARQLASIYRDEPQAVSELDAWGRAEGFQHRYKKFEPGGQHFGRVVTGIRDVDVQRRTRFVKTRAYETQAAGMEAGIEYSANPLAVFEQKMDTYLNGIINKRMYAIIEPLSKKPSEMIDQELTQKAIEATNELRKAASLERTLKAIRDGMSIEYEAVKGTAAEAMHGKPPIRQELKWADERMPGFLEKVRIAAKIRKGKKRNAAFAILLEDATSLREELAKAAKAAKTARAKAIERAQSAEVLSGEAFGEPGSIGVGHVRQSWASGRVFPRDVADTLNKEFEPEVGICCVP
jgi:hypothetical protein